MMGLFALIVLERVCNVPKQLDVLEQRSSWLAQKVQMRLNSRAYISDMGERVPWLLVAAQG
jgi:hypothetical protein